MRDATTDALGGIVLLEREAQAAAIDAVVCGLIAGRGGVVAIEGAPGLGRSSLVDLAVGRARAAGVRTRSVRAVALEQGFALGTVRALLEAPLREADGHELAQGPAAPAARLLSGAAQDAGGDPAVLAHGMLWLCAHLARRRPLLLTIDDAHWADAASLTVLAALARRLADVPVGLVIAARPGAGGPSAAVLAELAHAAAPELAPLSAGATIRLVRMIAPECSQVAARRIHDASGGRPWLARALAEQPCGSASVPASLGVVLRRRLAAAGPEAQRAASALAVLDAPAGPRLLGALAELDGPAVARARDALAAADLLDADGRGLVHPLVAQAIAEGLPPATRDRIHAAAARELRQAGADPARVAHHLRRQGPDADPGVAALLRESAARRRGAGDVRGALEDLQRALLERASAEDDALAALEIAAINVDAALPGAPRAMADALAHAGALDAAALGRLASLSIVAGSAAEVAEHVRSRLAAGAGGAQAAALEGALLDALLAVAAGHVERRRRAREGGAAQGSLLDRRVLCAHQAWAGAERGEADADTVSALAREALEGDVLLHAAGERAGWHLAVRALIACGRGDDADRAIAALEAQAGRAPRGRATAAWLRAERARHAGRVDAAAVEARLVLELLGTERSPLTGGAIAVALWAAAERGAFGHAHELLEGWGLDGEIVGRPWAIAVPAARAALRLAEGDYAAALADADAAGEEALAARALAHLGEVDGARSRADRAWSAAEQAGVATARLAAGHARLVAEPDDQARLALAGEVGRLIGPRSGGLEVARLHFEHGRTLSRLRRRVQAREPLQAALAAADAVGARLLAQRARDELVATGLRPRRAQTEGVDALTPRQREVARLAAAGRSNRDIARALFVSVKTVETHLAATYEKLHVDGREALADVLEA